MKRAIFVAFGALFGFLLSRARATDYDAILGMFLLVDLHLFGVIGVAIASAALGLYLERRTRAHTLFGDPICIEKKPARSGALAGGVVFGVGWALAGACPGTALTQIGEGKLYAFATAAGILAGTWIAKRIAGAASAPRREAAHAS
jgi:uncharacterized membrane protein YedE/YeeE